MVQPDRTFKAFSAVNRPTKPNHNVVAPLNLEFENRNPDYGPENLTLDSPTLNSSAILLSYLFLASRIFVRKFSSVAFSHAAEKDEIRNVIHADRLVAGLSNNTSEHSLCRKTKGKQNC